MASGPLPAWAAACFFVSGAAGLIYEVAWSKQLAYLLGNSLHAAATVVAAFLAGLALGARFLGVPLARRANGARIYALLEVGIALLGLLSLPVLRGLDPLVGSLYRSLGGETGAFGFARVLLLSALLLPPATLMGSTLPVLVATFERSLVGPALARLYAVNTFGAVAGSVIAGFALLPGVGLLAATWIAAALNAVAAALAWTSSRRSRPAQVATAKAPAPRSATGPEPLGRGERIAVALLFGLSGFGALAFQIAWMRLFGLVFGSSVYSFSAVLGVYLLGLAAGSAAIGRALRRGGSLLGFGALQLALATTCALALHLFPRLPEWMYGLMQAAAPRWLAVFAGEVAMVAAVVFVPCALLGAIFPVATQLLQKGDSGHATGFAYAVNTLGTIGGSLAAGFVMVPWLGVAGTHRMAVLLSLVIGVVALVMVWRQRPSRPRTALALLALVLAGTGALAFTAPRWDPSLMSAGLYRPNEAAFVGARAGEGAGDGATVWKGTRFEHVLFYREGLNGSVLVGQNDESGNRWLRVGGKVEASTGDLETQVMLGLIPAACADSGARTLVIGLGSGFTAAAALAAGTGRTDIVELEPAVVEASHLLHAPEDDPLRDPRAHLIIGDARTHLAHSGVRYQMIVSEPSNPWVAGVNNLFTVDFYRLVRARLEPGGVFCQWLQLYELTPETFASLVASLLEVFPEGHAFAVWDGYDALLVAMPPSAHLALERLRSPAARLMLERAHLGSPEELAAYYAGSFAALRRNTAGAPLNSDDRPIVEYRAPRDLVSTGGHAPGEKTAASLLPVANAMPAGPLYGAWDSGQWYEARSRYFLARGDTAFVVPLIQGAEAAGQLDAARRLRQELEGSAR